MSTARPPRERKDPGRWAGVSTEATEPQDAELQAEIKAYRAKLTELYGDKANWYDREDQVNWVDRFDRPLAELPLVIRGRSRVEARSLTRLGFEVLMLDDPNVETSPKLRAHYNAFSDKEKYLDAGILRAWVILKDWAEKYPPIWSFENAHANAEQWRDSLPDSFRDAEMLVLPDTDENGTAHVQAILALPGRKTGEEVKRRLDQHRGKDGEARFRVLDRAEWYGDAVHLTPGGGAVRSLATLQAGQAPAGPSRVYPSGLPELDALYRDGGIPDDSFVVVVGPTGSLKTTLLVALAATIAEAGHKVAWLAAGDEHKDRIERRFSQRPSGRPDGERLYILDRSPTTDLGAVLAADADAVILDSLQGYAGSEIQKLEDTIGQIRESRKLVIATSELSRMGQPKGTEAIPYRATTHLDLRVKKGALHVRVLKNRDGEGAKDGSVGFELAPNLERQTLVGRYATPEPEPEPAPADGRIRAEIRELLGQEPRSKTWLRDRVRGDSKVIIRTIEEMLGGGELESKNRKLHLT